MTATSLLIILIIFLIVFFALWGRLLLTRQKDIYKQLILIDKKIAIAGNQLMKFLKESGDEKRQQELVELAKAFKQKYNKKNKSHVRKHFQACKEIIDFMKENLSSEAQFETYNNFSYSFTNVKIEVQKYNDMVKVFNNQSTVFPGNIIANVLKLEQNVELDIDGDGENFFG